MDYQTERSGVLSELSLFSGYGGFSLGLRLAGLNIRTVAYVEWAKYPQEIIKARIKDGYLDDAPIFSDISTFRGEQFRGLADLVSGGFPCQPHSGAGLQRGANDERNLWPDTLRIIREVGPRYVLLENVPGLIQSGKGRQAYGGTVLGQLAQAGYVCRWATVGADDVGAPHRRKRWWCIGVLVNTEGEGPGGVRDEGIKEGPRHSDVVPGVSGIINNEELADCTEQGLEGVRPNDHSQGRQEPYGSVDVPSRTIPTWPPSPSDAHAWERVLRIRPDLAPAITKEAESQFRRMDNGSSDRLDRPPANDRVNRLKALGNGIVPQSLAEFLRRVTNA